VVLDPEGQIGLLLFDTARNGFSEKFMREYGIRIDFTPDALREIRNRADRSRIRPDFLCEGLFKDYGLGLKLVNAKEFTVTSEVLENPKEYLERLIQEHYRKE
jgi:hypothetical protein